MLSNFGCQKSCGTKAKISPMFAAYKGGKLVKTWHGANNKRFVTNMEAGMTLMLKKWLTIVRRALFQTFPDIQKPIDTVIFGCLFKKPFYEQEWGFLEVYSLSMSHHEPAFPWSLDMVIHHVGTARIDFLSTGATLVSRGRIAER